MPLFADFRRADTTFRRYDSPCHEAAAFSMMALSLPMCRCFTPAAAAAASALIVERALPLLRHYAAMPLSTVHRRRCSRHAAFAGFADAALLMPDAVAAV